jgi:hypothetical protein
MNLWKNKPDVPLNAEILNAKKSTRRWKTAAIVLLTSGLLNFAVPAYAFGDAAAIIAYLTPVLGTTLPNFMTQLIQQKLGGLITNVMNTNFGQLGQLTTKLGTLDPSRLSSIFSSMLSSNSAQPFVEEGLKDFISPPDGTGTDMNKIAPNMTNAEAAVLVLSKQAEAQLKLEDKTRIIQNASKAEAAGKPVPKDPSGKTPPQGGAPGEQNLANAAAAKAAANNLDHKELTERGARSLDANNAATVEEDILLTVYKAARKKGEPLAEADATDLPDYKFQDKETQLALSRFLTSPPVIPAELAPSYDNAALDKNRAAVLENVLMGTSPLPLLPRNMMNRANARSLQMKMFTRFARLGLARQAIYASLSPEQHRAMNEEYATYVAKPSALAQLFAGVTPAQQQMIELLRGNNLFLMRMREKQLEQNRLLGVILTSLTEANTREQADRAMLGSTESTPTKATQ